MLPRGRGGSYVCGGVVEQHPISSMLYNTIAAFGPEGQEVARYRKVHLSQVSVGEDKTSEGSVLQACPPPRLVLGCWVTPCGAR